MPNLDVAPQGPVKIIRKYQLVYKLKTGDFQVLEPSVAQEGIIDAATALLGTALTPTASVSEITIKIGNNQNTA
jgi:hypothetical protein